MFARSGYVLVAALALVISLDASAQLLIEPGQTYTTLIDDDSSCYESPETAPETTRCDVGFRATETGDTYPVIKLWTEVLGVIGADPDKKAIGRLYKEIQIATSSSPDASGLVKVNFAGDFLYTGIVSALSNGALEPGVAQVVANFKLLDEPISVAKHPTGAIAIGNVVASKNILTESVDLDRGNLLDDDKVSRRYIVGSGAFDFSAHLERGRTYSIMVELECISLVRLTSLGIVCDFEKDTVRRPLSGLVVPPVTITAVEDVPELISDGLGSDIDTVLTNTLTIANETSVLTSNTAALLSDTAQILSDVSQHDSEIKAEISDLRTRLVSLEADVGEVQDGLLEVVRLLHEPSGVRQSELEACEGETCTWNYAR